MIDRAIERFKQHVLQNPPGAVESPPKIADPQKSPHPVVFAKPVHANRRGGGCCGGGGGASVAKPKTAVVFAFYRVEGTLNPPPIERLNDHFRWNDVFYRTSKARVYVVADQEYRVPRYAKCLVYPEPLPVFSNARCKNHGIRAAIAASRDPIIATDVDIAFTPEAWGRMLAVTDKEAVACTVWLASSFETRMDECDGRAVPFHARACRKSHKDNGACGTVCMQAANWSRIQFDDRLVGYGCDDPLLKRDILAAGLEVVGTAKSKFNVKIYHIAHSSGPQSNFCDNDHARTDRWSPDFNPINFGENRKFYLGRNRP